MFGFEYYFLFTSCQLNVFSNTHYWLTRIIQSLYYAPAGRYINSSSESADRGCSIRVNYWFEIEQRFFRVP